MKFSIGCVTAVLRLDSVFGKELVQSFVSPTEHQAASNVGDLHEKNHPYASSYSLTKDTSVFKRLKQAQRFRDAVHAEPNKVKNQDEEERLPYNEVIEEVSNPEAPVENIKIHHEIKDDKEVSETATKGAADFGNLLTLEDGNLLQRKDLIKRYLQDHGEIPHDDNRGIGFTNQKAHTPIDVLTNQPDYDYLDSLNLPITSDFTASYIRNSWTIIPYILLLYR